MIYEDSNPPFKNNPYITLGNDTDRNIRSIANNGDYEKLCGKIAVSVYYNLPLSRDIDSSPLKVFYKPQQRKGNLDVITVTNNQDLPVPVSGDVQSDAYFLCQKKGAHIGLIGVAPKGLVINAPVDSTSYSQACYKVKRDNLKPIPKKDNLKPIPSP